jgi:2-polyprenyl-6-methoxyphenol hydroxylase-like FAD-dependent oxidoreductase
MAFEDAVILCRKLKEVKDLSVRDDVCNALRNYENERLVRVRRVQDWTSDQVRLAYSVPTNNAGIATGDEGAAIALLEELREKIAKGEKSYNEWLFQGV